jgi:hypothetical protein
MPDRQQNRTLGYYHDCAQGFTKGYTLLQGEVANNGIHRASNAMNMDDEHGFGGKGTSDRATTYLITLLKAWQN